MTTVSPIKQIELLTKRLEKARKIMAEGRVYPMLKQEGHYVVLASDNAGFYMVNGDCDCADAQERVELHHGWCKHKLAVELYKEQQEAAAAEPEQPKITGNSGSPKDEDLEAKIAELYS